MNLCMFYCPPIKEIYIFKGYYVNWWKRRSKGDRHLWLTNFWSPLALPICKICKNAFVTLQGAWFIPKHKYNANYKKKPLRYQSNNPCIDSAYLCWLGLFLFLLLLLLPVAGFPLPRVPIPVSAPTSLAVIPISLALPLPSIPILLKEEWSWFLD